MDLRYSAEDEEVRNWLTVLKGNAGLRYVWLGVEDPLPLAERIAVADKAVEIAEGLGVPELLSQAYRTYGLLQSFAGRWDVTVAIAGLPLAGLAAALWMNLPTFACLMSGAFLLAAGLTCHRGIAACTGEVVRLLVSARLVVVLVLASLLLVATGAVWTSLVSGVLIWLVADRLLGRATLRDLVELTRER